MKKMYKILVFVCVLLIGFSSIIFAEKLPETEENLETESAVEEVVKENMEEPEQEKEVSKVMTTLNKLPKNYLKILILPAMLMIAIVVAFSILLKKKPKMIGHGFLRGVKNFLIFLVVSWVGFGVAYAAGILLIK